MNEVEDISSRLQLTFDNPPKNGLQWVFGNDPSVCDVLLGGPKQGISQRHFCISFDEKGRLILEAQTNSRFMILNYYDKPHDQSRQNYFRWILFPWASPMVVTLGKEPRKKKKKTATLDKGVDIKEGAKKTSPKTEVRKSKASRPGASKATEYLTFRIELPDYESYKNAYKARVNTFLEVARHSFPSIEQMNFRSREATAPGTGPVSPKSKQEPIYIRGKKLGGGYFGVVYRVRDASTGEEYAAKYLARPQKVAAVKSSTTPDASRATDESVASEDDDTSQVFSTTSELLLASKVEDDDVYWEREIAILRSISHVSMTVYSSDTDPG